MQPSWTPRRIGFCSKQARSGIKSAVPSKPAAQSSIPIKCPSCTRWLPRNGGHHICIVPTENEVMGHLTGDLRNAWLKLREVAASLGEQRIYASAKAVMFSRSSCYFFTRPKKASLELCIFLAGELDHPGIKSRKPVSKQKIAHTVLIQHEDQIEAPLTEWLQVAWQQTPP